MTVDATRSPWGSLSLLPWSKGHGTGNDFVLVADPDDTYRIDAEATARICDRHQGIGADGLIRAVRSQHVPEGGPLLRTTPEAEWFMDYRNSDGTAVEMCGNGVRVFVHFLIDQGLVELAEGGEIIIGTRGGPRAVKRQQDGYVVDMGPWDLIFPDTAAGQGTDSLVEAGGMAVARPALSISMGNPHTVLALAHADELRGLDLHRQPQVDPVPPAGTNVEFVLPSEPLVTDGTGVITMRVHERGVGETQSCGTGACAAAAAIRYWAGRGAPDDWAVQVPGGVVSVTFFDADDGVEHVLLGGPAELVATGVLS
ncbi:diaminopimelate epimerase [Arthrobacter castelli]|uniref:diaminopimelate epimerase n=1 Tax=Arthrobacter castelli TaxID=271431 RepID=UPI00047C74C2|nr:diaminopimelate epimerase [Arthrobacter castelli]